MLTFMLALVFLALVWIASELHEIGDRFDRDWNNRGALQPTGLRSSGAKDTDDDFASESITKVRMPWWKRIGLASIALLAFLVLVKLFG